ncbi:MAG: hypothetical protein WD232_10100 [Acidimicrobiales bacterium]
MTGCADETSEDEDRAPICPTCGVTALPREAANVLDPTFVCENPDCEAYGDEV